MSPLLVAVAATQTPAGTGAPPASSLPVNGTPSAWAIGLLVALVLILAAAAVHTIRSDRKADPS